MEVAGGIFGHVGADLGHFQQLGLAFGVSLLLSQIAAHLGAALAVGDAALQRVLPRPQVDGLAHGVVVVDMQVSQLGVHLLDDAAVAHVDGLGHVHAVVAAVTGAVAVPGIDEGVVVADQLEQFLLLGVNVVLELILHGLVLPVLGNGANLSGVGSALVEVLQGGLVIGGVEQEFALVLGIPLGPHGAGGIAAAQKLLVVEIQGDVFENVLHCQAPADGVGLAVGLFPGLGDQTGSPQGDAAVVTGLHNVAPDIISAVLSHVISSL